MEDADDFRYLVRMRFEEKGPLGLRLVGDEEGCTTLQGVVPGTAAAARELLACEGLLLMRIEAGAAQFFTGGTIAPVPLEVRVRSIVRVARTPVS